jgi:hypothetical protein
MKPGGGEALEDEVLMREAKLYLLLAFGYVDSDE